MEGFNKWQCMLFVLYSGWILFPLCKTSKHILFQGVVSDVLPKLMYMSYSFPLSVGNTSLITWVRVVYGRVILLVCCFVTCLQLMKIQLHSFYFWSPLHACKIHRVRRAWWIGLKTRSDCLCDILAIDTNKYSIYIYMRYFIICHDDWMASTH